MNEYIIEMKNITKNFGRIKALDNVTLQVKHGEIHALLGENGAGKSTLMSILFGMNSPDEGHIKIEGIERKIQGPKDATDYGIGMVHQHFQLVKNFTVLENIILGVEDKKHGLVDTSRAREKVIDLSARYGLHINPDAVVSEISLGMQQRVEILKMLYRDNKILIFDEPTAVLTPQEISELLNIIKGLSNEGKSIIFISHKLKEIKEVGDRCTILRKGKSIETLTVIENSQEKMAELMVGRKISDYIDKKPLMPGEAMLKVSSLNMFDKYQGKNVLNNINFAVHSGEIVCIAGIDGNGQSELIQAITGMNQNYDGEIVLNGIDITTKSIRYRNIHGISCIPEDRHKDGLILDYSIEQNLVSKKYFTNLFSKRGFIRFTERHAFAKKMIQRFDIRSSGDENTLVKEMSGGNQQKIIIAREIDMDSPVLIAAQPTRGLDVGAIEGVQKQLIRQRDMGKSVLLISFELDEVFRLSDRILILYEGEIVGEFNPVETSAEELGLYMSGAKRMVRSK